MYVIRKLLEQLPLLIRYFPERRGDVLVFTAFYDYRPQPDFFKKRLEIGIAHDDPDAAGYRTRVGNNAVRGRCHIISARSCDGAQGGDDRLILDCFSDFPINLLRRADSAAGGVDPQNNGLDAILPPES